MCGICGIIAKNSRRHENKIQKMMQGFGAPVSNWLKLKSVEELKKKYFYMILTKKFTKSFLLKIAVDISMLITTRYGHC
jgi:hypothetical protein